MRSTDSLEKSTMQPNKRQRNAIIYLGRVDGKNDRDALRAELYGFAESKHFSVQACIFDLKGNLPVALLSLARSLNRYGKYYLIVKSVNALDFGDTSAEAMIRYLSDFSGITVVEKERTRRIDPFSILLNEINSYYGLGIFKNSQNACDHECRYAATPGRVPFGYRVKNGFIECNEQEAKVVNAVFELYAKGTEIIKINDELSDMFPNTEIPAISQIPIILSKGKYIGSVNADERFPAIIPKYLWLKASSARKTPKFKFQSRFLTSKIISDEHIYLYPAEELRGYRRLVYAGSVQDECVVADEERVDKAISDAISELILSDLDQLREDLIAYTLKVRIESGAKLARLKSLKKELDDSGSKKYENCCDSPDFESLQAMSNRLAELHLIEIAERYESYRHDLANIENEAIDGFLEHLSNFDSISETERQYFAEVFVRRCELSNGKLKLLLLGKEPLLKTINIEPQAETVPVSSIRFI